MRTHLGSAVIVTLAVGAVAVALALGVAPPPRADRVRPLGHLFEAHPAAGEGALPPELADLRLRVTSVRRGKTKDTPGWTWLDGRIETSDGPLPLPPPFFARTAVAGRAVFASETPIPLRGRLDFDGLTGAFAIHCGTAAAEPRLGELDLTVEGLVGGWRTERVTLLQGESFDRDFGPFRLSVGPSPIDADRQLDGTFHHDLVPAADDPWKPFHDRFPFAGSSLVEARDAGGPLLRMGGAIHECGATEFTCWWVDDRRIRRIRWPVVVSVHLPRDPAGMREERVRFVIRDVPLDVLPVD